jgi:hypothetical protein
VKENNEYLRTIPFVEMNFSKKKINYLTDMCCFLLLVKLSYLFLSLSLSLSLFLLDKTQWVELDLSGPWWSVTPSVLLG